MIHDVQLCINHVGLLTPASVSPEFRDESDSLRSIATFVADSLESQMWMTIRRSFPGGAS
jgi:hypothetical protein